MDHSTTQEIARHVLVTGRVQGVAFRWSTQDKARELGVSGWVRNLHDGRVEAWLEGPVARVRALLDWLGQGPRMARVTGLDVSDRDPEGFERFEVRASAR